MKKLLFIVLLLCLSFAKYSFAATLKDYILPTDGAGTKYGALVGYDEVSKTWKLLQVKRSGEDLYLDLQLGTVTTQVLGSITSVIQIDEPIWEAQPEQLTNNNLKITLAAYSTYTCSSTWTTSFTGYTKFLEYIVIIRDEPLPIDHYNFEFHTKQLVDSLYLAGEVAPASPITIHKPPIPIPLYQGNDNGWRFIIQNKANVEQKFKIALIFSIRKSN